MKGKLKNYDFRSQVKRLRLIDYINGVEIAIHLKKNKPNGVKNNKKGKNEFKIRKILNKIKVIRFNFINNTVLLLKSKLKRRKINFHILNKLINIQINLM